MFLFYKSENISLEKGWFKDFALVEDSYSKYCGCPFGTSYQKRGELSNMLHMLSSNDKNDNQLPEVNVRKASFLHYQENILGYFFRFRIVVSLIGMLPIYPLMCL